MNNGKSIPISKDKNNLQYRDFVGLLSVKALAMLFSTDIGIEADPLTYTAFCPP